VTVTSQWSCHMLKTEWATQAIPNCPERVLHNGPKHVAVKRRLFPQPSMLDSLHLAFPALFVALEPWYQFPGLSIEEGVASVLVLRNFLIRNIGVSYIKRPFEPLRSTASASPTSRS